MYWWNLAKLPTVHMDILRGVEFYIAISLMAYVLFLLSPIPHYLKQNMLVKIKNRTKIASAIRTIYRTLLAVGCVLLIDAIWQTYIYTDKYTLSDEAEMFGEQDHSVKQDIESNLLLNQRNLYLTTWGLFLLLVGRRMTSMFLQLSDFEDQIGQLKSRHVVKRLPPDGTGKSKLEVLKQTLQVVPDGHDSTIANAVAEDVAVADATEVEVVSPNTVESIAAAKKMDWEGGKAERHSSTEDIPVNTAC